MPVLRAAVVSTLLALGALSSCGWASSVALAPAPVDRALELAQQRDAYLVVEFTAKTCEACREFEAVTLGDERVNTELQRFDYLIVDMRLHRTVAEYYGIEEAPAVLVFSPGGDERFRAWGVLDPEGFVELLQERAPEREPIDPGLTARYFPMQKVLKSRS